MNKELSIEPVPQGSLDPAWFEQRRECAGLSRGEIAAVLSLAETALEDVLSGKRILSFHEGKKLAEIFALPMSEVSKHLHICATPVSAEHLARELRLVREDAHDAVHRLSRLEKAALHLKAGLARLGTRKF